MALSRRTDVKVGALMTVSIEDDRHAPALSSGIDFIGRSEDFLFRKAGGPGVKVIARIAFDSISVQRRANRLQSSR